MISNRLASSLVRWIQCWWSTWSTRLCTPSIRRMIISLSVTPRKTAKQLQDPGLSMWWDVNNSKFSTIAAFVLIHAGLLYKSLSPISVLVLLQPTIADLLSISWWASSAAWWVESLCLFISLVCITTVICMGVQWHENYKWRWIIFTLVVQK